MKSTILALLTLMTLNAKAVTILCNYGDQPESPLILMADANEDATYKSFRVTKQGASQIALDGQTYSGNWLETFEMVPNKQSADIKLTASYGSRLNVTGTRGTKELQINSQTGEATLTHHQIPNILNGLAPNARGENTTITKLNCRPIYKN